jgi:hypothetical protein
MVRDQRDQLLHASVAVIPQLDPVRENRILDRPCKSCENKIATSVKACDMSSIRLKSVKRLEADFNQFGSLVWLSSP